MNIIRNAVYRKLSKNEPLNILTGCDDERLQNMLCATKHMLYGVNITQPWNKEFISKPVNFTCFDFKNNINDSLPSWLDIDLIISQDINKENNKEYSLLKEFSVEYNIPLITIIKHITTVSDNITDYPISIVKQPKLSYAPYGVNTELFRPLNKTRQQFVGSYCLCNLVQNGTELGYGVWEFISNSFPSMLGGYNQHTKSMPIPYHNLPIFFNDCGVYVNTRLQGFPIEMLEAMACECAVVSVDNQCVFNVIDNKKNGFICKNQEELANTIKMLLADQKLAKQIGIKARQTVLEQYNINNTSKIWNKLFEEIR